MGREAGWGGVGVGGEGKGRGMWASASDRSRGGKGWTGAGVWKREFGVSSILLLSAPLVSLSPFSFYGQGHPMLSYASLSSRSLWLMPFLCPSPRSLYTPCYPCAQCAPLRVAHAVLCSSPSVLALCRPVLSPCRPMPPPSYAQCAPLSTLFYARPPYAAQCTQAASFPSSSFSLSLSLSPTHALPSLPRHAPSTSSLSLSLRARPSYLSSYALSLFSSIFSTAHAFLRALSLLLLLLSSFLCLPLAPYASLQCASLCLPPMRLLPNVPLSFSLLCPSALLFVRLFLSVPLALSRSLAYLCGHAGNVVEHRIVLDAQCGELPFDPLPQRHPRSESWQPGTEGPEGWPEGRPDLTMATD